jgi:hypothetical protein
MAARPDLAGVHSASGLYNCHLATSDAAPPEAEFKLKDTEGSSQSATSLFGAAGSPRRGLFWSRHDILAWAGGDSDRDAGLAARSK